jgi:hypothetical protein
MTSSVYLHFYEKLAQNAKTTALKVLNHNDVLPVHKKRTVKRISKSSLLKTHLEHDLIVLLLCFQQVNEGGQDP